MSDYLAEPLARETDADRETEIAEIFAEIERLNAQMRADDIEIARLRQEADIYKAKASQFRMESECHHTELQKLRQASEPASQETRATLDRLKAMLYA